jgi:hypothetical protein
MLTAAVLARELIGDAQALTFPCGRVRTWWCPALAALFHE